MLPDYGFSCGHSVLAILEISARRRNPMGDALNFCTYL